MSNLMNMRNILICLFFIDHMRHIDKLHKLTNTKDLYLSSIQKYHNFFPLQDIFDVSDQMKMPS